MHNWNETCWCKIKHIDSSNKNNEKDLKFKIGDIVRISKYKNNFAKGYTPNWSEELFVIKKVENTVPWIHVINGLKGEEIVGTFQEKELQKTNQKELRIEKVIKRKEDKVYVKWKGYNNLFNSWIDKKDSINELIFSKTKIFRSKCKSWIRFV